MEHDGGSSLALSRWLISARRFAELASIACSRCGRTTAQYSGMSTTLDSSENERRAMNSNYLAVFAACLQCTDEVNAMPRGTPWPLKQQTGGVELLVTAAEKNWRKVPNDIYARHNQNLDLVAAEVYCKSLIFCKEFKGKTPGTYFSKLIPTLSEEWSSKFNHGLHGLQTLCLKYTEVKSSGNRFASPQISCYFFSYSLN